MNAVPSVMASKGAIVACVTVGIALLGLLLSTHQYWRRGGLDFSRALWLGAVTGLAGAGASFWRALMLEPNRFPMHRIRELNNLEFMGVIACAGLFVLAVAPFIVMLYRKWTGVTLTDAERRPGNVGVRAWLTLDKLELALVVALAGWFGLGFPLLMMLACTFAALLAFPLFNVASARPEGFAPPALEAQGESEESGVAAEEAMSAEQAKVLALLEEGKISAQESAELLSALGEPRRETAAGQPLSTGRRLLMVGVAVVLVGFLLPWFKIDIFTEAARMQESMQENMQRNWMPGQPPRNSIDLFSILSTSGLSADTPIIHGGGTPQGLGWLVLVLAVGAALAPLAGTSLTPQARWAVTSGALAFGAIILLYLLTQCARYISYGYVIVLIGYALSFAGAMKERSPVKVA